MFALNAAHGSRWGSSIERNRFVFSLSFSLCRPLKRFSEGISIRLIRIDSEHLKIDREKSHWTKSTTGCIFKIDVKQIREFSQVEICKSNWSWSTISLPRFILSRSCGTSRPGKNVAVGFRTLLARTPTKEKRWRSPPTPHARSTTERNAENAPAYRVQAELPRNCTLRFYIGGSMLLELSRAKMVRDGTARESKFAGPFWNNAAARRLPRSPHSQARRKSAREECFQEDRCPMSALSLSLSLFSLHSAAPGAINHCA